MSGHRSHRAQPRKGPKRNEGKGYLGKTFGGKAGPGWPTLGDGTQVLPGTATAVRLSEPAGEVGHTDGMPYWSEDRGWLIHVRFPSAAPSLVECHVGRLEAAP